MPFALPVPAVERYWRGDWESLLRKEGIEAGSDDETLLAALIPAEIDVQPWTEQLIRRWCGCAAPNVRQN